MDARFLKVDELERGEGAGEGVDHLLFFESPADEEGDGSEGSFRFFVSILQF